MLPQYYAAYKSAFRYYATGYQCITQQIHIPWLHNVSPHFHQQQETKMLHYQINPRLFQDSLIRMLENHSGSSNVRQRNVNSQSTVSHNGTQSAPVVGNTSPSNSVVVDTRPRTTQSSVFSLIVLWVIAVSIIALVCRRLFVVSWDCVVGVSCVHMHYYIE